MVINMHVNICWSNWVSFSRAHKRVATKALFFSVGNLGCGMGECGKGGEGVGESW